ncbi:MAG TPA: response regulator transcription factor [Candidatus Limnocylindrales bacterium]
MERVDPLSGPPRAPSNARVLVVDDEPPIVELVRGYLEREGMAVVVATDGEAAVELARRIRPDVVVLDVMLPGLDGIEVCRQIRTFSDTFVLMLTARAEEVDTLVGLAVGADDYLTKPFSPRELVARVKALLRRSRSPNPASSATAPATPVGLALDVARHTVRVDGSIVELTPTEFAILATLARDPGVVVTRGGVLDAVWGAEFVGDDHLVDVHVANLRRKLGDDPERPRFVDTVRGIGYRLRGPA